MLHMLKWLFKYPPLKKRLSFCEPDSDVDVHMTEQFWKIKVECGSLKSLARMLQEWPWMVMGGHFGNRTVITALPPALTWPEISRKSDNHSSLLWTWPKGKEYSQREREVLSSVFPGKPITNLYLHSRAPEISKEQEAIWRESSSTCFQIDPIVTQIPCRFQ